MTVIEALTMVLPLAKGAERRNVVLNVDTMVTLDTLRKICENNGFFHAYGDLNEYTEEKATESKALVVTGDYRESYDEYISYGRKNNCSIVFVKFGPDDAAYSHDAESHLVSNECGMNAGELIEALTDPQIAGDAIVVYDGEGRGSEFVIFASNHTNGPGFYSDTLNSVPLGWSTFKAINVEEFKEFLSKFPSDATLEVCGCIIRGVNYYGDNVVNIKLADVDTLVRVFTNRLRDN